MRLLHFVRALKNDVVILRKCPWGAMTVYPSTDHLLILLRILYGSNEETTLDKGKRSQRKVSQ
jgi:hypothetical protein